MKTLKDFDFKNKRILVRCDFNVPLDKEGNILDDFRISQTIPTIEHLVKKGAKVILMSHLGRPGGKVVEGLRITPIQKKLMEYLDLSVTKAPDCIGKEIEKWTQEMQPGEILLLENLKFHEGEKKGDFEFARKLARLGDIYINDAFGTCHWAYASIVGIPKYLPSGAGLLLEKEIRVLSKVLKNPWKPLIAIIGGVKIFSKIKVINQFLQKADHLLLGGEIANNILIAKGISVGKPFPEQEVIKEIGKINLTDPKLHLPVDVIASPDTTGKVYVRQASPGGLRKEEMNLDIGPETIKIFSEIIKAAKMIVWSGPLGKFEEELFEKGTKEIAEAVARNHNAFRIAGGGDTISALAKFGLREKFDHVSTGGGAMLQFLSGERLPGIEALK